MRIRKVGREDGLGNFFLFHPTLLLTASLALIALLSACLFLLFRIVSGTAGSFPSTAIF